MKGKFWSHVIVLCALLLPAAAGTEVRADPAAMGTPSDSSPMLASASTIPDTAAPSGGLNRLYPEELDPPGSCGVPLGGPFGQDVEILLNDIQYELDPGWYPQDAILNLYCFPGGIQAEPLSDFAAAPLGTERIAAVWREGCGAFFGQLFYSIWDAASGVLAAEPLGLPPEARWRVLCRGLRSGRERGRARALAVVAALAPVAASLMQGRQWRQTVEKIVETETWFGLG